LATRMNGVTAYVVTYNEEKTLPDCLRSLDWCDEVLVVDSFSEDRTCAVAADHGARVIQNKWPGYAQQKQFALSNVRTRWAINLDADERVSPDLQKSICAAISRGDGAAGYAFRRTTFHLGRFFRNGNLFERVLRLGQCSHSAWLGENVHERLKIEGSVGWLDGELVHHRDRNLSKELIVRDVYSTFKAKEMYARGVRPGAIMLLSHTFMSFVQSFVFKRGFLSGVPGLIVALEHASYTFYKYAKCWEMVHAPWSESAGERQRTATSHRRPPREDDTSSDRDQLVTPR
jgi:glycosyltransferase involved in cell wall biosynthesis